MKSNIVFKLYANLTDIFCSIQGLEKLTIATSETYYFITSMYLFTYYANIFIRIAPKILVKIGRNYIFTNSDQTVHPFDFLTGI